MGGYITTGLSGLTAGEVSFLGTGGAATIIEPSAVGEVSMPLFVATAATEAVMLPYRGEVIATVASTPYDVGFVAGFDADGVKSNAVVQSYGELVMARTGSFTGEAGYADTAPTDAALILDIEKNGTTIYATKPQFATTAQTLTAGVLKTDGTEDFVSGDRITFKITQIGSTLPGQGIRFTVQGTTALI